jgi:predicted amidohydrolase
MPKLVDACANIIIFPEMAVSANTLERIKNAAKELGMMSDSPLRLVVAGTTPVPSHPGNDAGRPYNQGVLINHRGEEIGRQRKLHRWDLNNDSRVTYGVRPPDDDIDDLKKNERLYENIEPGDEMQILESPWLGRMAVLICESLARTKPGMEVLENLWLDWLFTPVLDGSLEPRRWAGQASFDKARAGRCRVVVANSMALTLAANNAKETIEKEGREVPTSLENYPVRNVGVGLCIDTLENGQAPRCRVVRSWLPKERSDDRFAASEAVPWDPDAWENLDLRQPDELTRRPPGVSGRVRGARAGAEAPAVQAAD